MLNILLLVVSLWAQPVTLEQWAAERTVKIVAPVKGGWAQGTGIYISETEILSEFHVTGATKGILVLHRANLRWSRAVLVSSDAAKDFAVLRIHPFDFPRKAKVAKIKQTEWNYGEEFVIVGNSAVRDFRPVKAKLVGSSFFKTDLGHARWMMEFEGEGLAPGFSGAGVFNKDGDVVGMIETCDTMRKNICSAIDAIELLFYLQERK